ncbi:MAG: hypothetical protein U0263_00595 [Polyangiaceae bacterium]
MSPGRLLFAFACGVAVSIGAIYFVLTHRPLTPESFEVMVASPTSIDVLSSNKQPFVELHFAGDALRYRISVERFKDFDDPNGFLRAASRQGAQLRFHIERGARQNPERPRIDPQPTVFVESMAVDGKEIYPLSKRIEWDAKNVLYARIIAVLFPLLTLYLGRLLWFSARKPSPT